VREHMSAFDPNGHADHDWATRQEGNLAVFLVTVLGVGAPIIVDSLVSRGYPPRLPRATRSTSHNSREDRSMKRLLIVLSVFALALIVSSAVSAQTDPRIGTWKLNIAKSTGDTPKSETRTYTQSGDSVTAHVERVNSDGSKQAYGVTNKADGKDYPWSGQGPGGADTVSVKRVGNAFEAEDKKGGKVIFKTTITFSGGGKVMTFTSKGVDAKGKPMDTVRVYDKQ